MSMLAFQILQILLDAPSSYLASWHIADQLTEMNKKGYDSQISWQYPHSPLDHAMKELIDKGLVEEMSNLGSRYRIIYTADNG